MEWGRPCIILDTSYLLHPLLDKRSVSSFCRQCEMLGTTPYEVVIIEPVMDEIVRVTEESHVYADVSEEILGLRRFVVESNTFGHEEDDDPPLYQRVVEVGRRLQRQTAVSKDLSRVDRSLCVYSFQQALHREVVVATRDVLLTSTIHTLAPKELLPCGPKGFIETVSKSSQLQHVLEALEASQECLHVPATYTR